MAIPAFTLARRLRAGETVSHGWCGLPYPIVAETIGREGFPGGHPRQPARPVGPRARSSPRSPRSGRPAQPRWCACRSAISPSFEPRARFRRRRHHRADDQHASRRARVRGGGQISADRRAQLGTAPRHDARRPHRPVGLSARSQRPHRHARDDRDAHRARQSRRDRRDAGYRRLVPRPLRPVDRAVERGEPRPAVAGRRARARPHPCRRAAGKQNSRRLLPPGERAAALAKRGVRFLAVASDLAMLRAGAAAALKALKG